MRMHAHQAHKELPAYNCNHFMPQRVQTQSEQSGITQKGENSTGEELIANQSTAHPAHRRRELTNELQLDCLTLKERQAYLPFRLFTMLGRELLAPQSSTRTSSRGQERLKVHRQTVTGGRQREGYEGFIRVEHAEGACPRQHRQQDLDLRNCQDVAQAHARAATKGDPAKERQASVHRL